MAQQEHKNNRRVHETAEKDASDSVTINTVYVPAKRMTFDSIILA